MVARTTIDTHFAGFVHNDMLLDMIGYYVLDASDYAQISGGLTDEWKGRFLWFNIDEEDNYTFASELYHTFVSSFTPKCEYIYAYDPVEKIRTNEAGETYWGDTDVMTKDQLFRTGQL